MAAVVRKTGSFVREATDTELSRVLADQDLDGTGRISIEEHYFHYFADTNGDGLLTPAEYASSLYPVGGFATHDINGDGVVSFVERKFVAATELFDDVKAVARRSLSDMRLTRAQWIFADLPSDFGTFESHASTVGTEAEVEPLGYSYYTILFTCALQAVRLYQVMLWKQSGVDLLHR